MSQKSGRCIAGLILMGSLPASADILYSVTDLGTLGGPASFGYALNNSGQVTGYSDSSTGFRSAFLYTSGHMTAVGGNTGYAINDAGQVAGSLDVSGGGLGLHAFRYDNGQLSDLGTLGGSSSIAYGINGAGQVTGWAELPSHDIHAFLYRSGQMLDLGTLGGSSSVGLSINKAGQIVGDSVISMSPYVSHAFLYSNGEMKDLGTLGGNNSIASSINDAGQITGYSETSGLLSDEAFLYTNGVMLGLGTLRGTTSAGISINNEGQVVGTSLDVRSEYHAFVYRSGRMNDLNDLIDPALGITLTNGQGINDNGQIVADSISHAYLLTPIPEPGPLRLAGIALLGLTMWMRARPKLRS